MVSHDLRSLLGGIVMSTDLIACNPGGSGVLADTDNIQRYAARMNRLIGDLVDVVSIDAGKLSVISVDCEATDVVSEVVATFVAAAADKGITLAADVAPVPMRVELDCERILQVLANLITNAMKFTPRGGSILLHTRRSGEELRFSVHDTGCGIRTDMIEAIFHRFWQAGRDDRRGLGLGLYISRCIVEAHGGRIWAESEPGDGTTISFSLPCRAKGPGVLSLVHNL
jgi:signal transduction histidine kinase